jgi:hypothetical protein
MWYWDGRSWRSTITTDGRWKWNGDRWIPAWSTPWRRQAVRPEISGYLLLGILALDLLGFVPGVFMTSIVAAIVLLAIDGRGLVTLNGLIKWRRMTFGQKVVAALVGTVLFQFVVMAYVAQRLFEMAKGAVMPGSARRHDAIQREPAAVVVGEPAASTPVDASDADSLQRALDAQLAEARSRLPVELLEKVRTLAAAIGEVLPGYRASALEQQDMFVVERTVNDYLPSALKRYLKLPATYRSVPLAEADGKTANEVLSDQLDLLINRIQQVVDNSYRDDLQALLVHGRFLQSKFGPSRLAVKA